ncbi:MAG: hypothetical protein HYT61_01625 [Candidatus Yanofskybacteria bacterium]|nr:hypothetical protein [Candidatus Yanofskybacteria bacterium]
MAINFKFNNFLKVLVPFSITQALGIYAAYKFLPDFLTVQPAGFSQFSFLGLVAFVAFAVIFIFTAIRFKKVGHVVFRVFLALLIFSGTQAVLGILFVPLISMIFALAVTILFWFLRNVIMQNIAMVFTLAGVGAVLGLSFLPMTIVYILVLFSFYDIISVYKTGHMIKLAQAMIESRAIFGFVIPETGSAIKHKIAQVVPGRGFMILGSGDVIFPLLLSASLARISIYQSVVVAVFSVLGLFLMHIIFTNQTIRRPMAALPPIALMSIVGYLIVNLI